MAETVEFYEALLGLGRAVADEDATYSPKDLALACRISSKTLDTWRKRGDIKLDLSFDVPSTGQGKSPRYSFNTIVATRLTVEMNSWGVPVSAAWGIAEFFSYAGTQEKDSDKLRPAAGLYPAEMGRTLFFVVRYKSGKGYRSRIAAETHGVDALQLLEKRNASPDEPVIEMGGGVLIIDCTAVLHDVCDLLGRDPSTLYSAADG